MIEHQRWTQSAITEMRSRLESGTSVEDVAEALARPVEAVRQMMSRLRLRARV